MAKAISIAQYVNQNYPGYSLQVYYCNGMGGITLELVPNGGIDVGGGFGDSILRVDIPDITGECSAGSGGSSPVYGCTNSKSPNYNVFATVDDGTCIDPPTQLYTVTGLVYLDGSPSLNNTITVLTPGNTTVTLTAPVIRGYIFGRWERHISNFNLVVSNLPDLVVDIAYSDQVFHAYYAFGSFPTPTPTPIPSSQPNLPPDIQLSLTPSATPTATPPEFVTRTPSPTPFVAPVSDTPRVVTPTPTPTRVLLRPVEVGEALLISPGAIEAVYDHGSWISPPPVNVQFTNLFTDSILTVNISSVYAYPTVLSLGPRETKTVVFTYTSIEYLESLAFGDTLGTIPITVSRELTPLAPPPPPPPTQLPRIRGCTNPTAQNYNSLATEDDGSCAFAQNGCMDPAASNYNPRSSLELPNSCVYRIALQQVSGNNQVVTNESGIVPAPLELRVVKVAADTGTTTPIARIPVLIQTNGSSAIVSEYGAFENTISTTTNSDGDIKVTWKIDTAVLNPQVRFTINPLGVPSTYTIQTGTTLFVATKQIVTPTVTNIVPWDIITPDITPVVTPTPISGGSTPPPTAGLPRDYIPPTGVPVQVSFVLDGGLTASRLAVLNIPPEIIVFRNGQEVIRTVFPNVGFTTAVDGDFITVNATPIATPIDGTLELGLSIPRFLHWRSGNTILTTLQQYTTTLSPSGFHGEAVYTLD